MNRPLTVRDNVTSIHCEFAAQANRNPNKVAVRYLQESVTYQQLDLRANYFARHLSEAGVCSDDIVAVEMSHSIEFVISMVAILKCGAAYLPFDGNGPAKRNSDSFIAAKVKLIIGTAEPEAAFGETYRYLSMRQKDLFATELAEFNSHTSSADDRAYVMFTSGSTGTPKGVVVPHRAVLRLVKEPNYIQIGSDDSILQFAPASFDASTFEFWGALLNCATLVLYSGTGLDPNLLRKEIAQNKVTILWLTAALFHLIADKFIHLLDPLRVLLAGGDVLNPKYINKVLDSIPGITVINGYGPTENTTFTCCHPMSVENRPAENVLIGKPIKGTEVHIVDEQMQPVAKGEVGELIADGDGVALGYLNNPNNTAFFYEPKLSSRLLYKTGDLVKENDRGELSFIGRKDNQVKIRGFRVSLEEVKTSIVELQEVSDAIVVTKKFDSGDQLLVAYVKPIEDQQCEAKEMRAQLSESLPDYMIPDRFVFDTELPINSSGKIDKQSII